MHADQAGDVQHTKGLAQNNQRDHNHLERDENTDDKPVVRKVKEWLALVSAQEVRQDGVQQHGAEGGKNRNHRRVLQGGPVATAGQNLLEEIGRAHV